MRTITTTLTADEMKLIEDFREHAPLRKRQKRAIDKRLAPFLVVHPGWKVSAIEWPQFWECDVTNGHVRIYVSVSGNWCCSPADDDDEDLRAAEFFGYAKTPALALAAAVRSTTKRLSTINALMKDATQ